MNNKDYRSLLTYALRLTKNMQDAQDLLHESWIDAQKKGLGDNCGFINSCIYYEWLHLLRARRYRKAYKDDLATLEEPFTLMSVVHIDVIKFYKSLKPLKRTFFDALVEHGNDYGVKLSEILKEDRNTLKYHVRTIKEAFKEAV
jgi:DNA-directed RNA polymerase specialized sigma24 family protein